MAGLPLDALQTHLQEYLNCLELCRALQKQVVDANVKEALDSLLGDGREALASLAGYLRQQGVAPGTYELDHRGKARIREVLALRALGDQLLVVRRCLADLVAWYDAHMPATPAAPTAQALLASLTAQTCRMLDRWDRHMDEMKAVK